MTLRMNFNSAAIRSQLNLTTVNRLLGQSIERLSSGVRINRSADDPAGMSIANRMRYQINALNTAVSNSENGINMLQTAEGAMDELSNALNTMRTLALDAANEAVNDPARLTALQNDFDAITASITRLAQNARFGSIPLLDGSQSQNTLERVARNGTPPSISSIAGLNHDITRMPAGIKEGSPITLDALDPKLVTQSVQVSLNDSNGDPANETDTIHGLLQNGQSLDLSSNPSISITGPLGSQTFTLDTTTTIDGLIADINNASATLGVTASYREDDGRLMIASTQSGATPLQISSDDMRDTTDPNAQPTGLLDGAPSDANTNPFAVPQSLATPLVKERIQVTLEINDGNPSPLYPSPTTTLNGLEQNGVPLQVAKGHEVSISGPTGTKTFTLTANTTVQSLVDQINAASDLLGVRASYQHSDGQLVIESTNFGHGSLRISSSDMSGTGIGLLDAFTADPAQNPLAIPREANVMSLADDRRGILADRDSLLIDVIGQDFGAFTNADGKRITVYGDGYADSLLLEGTSLEDILSFIEEHDEWFDGNVNWDENAQVLTVTDSDGIQHTLNLTNTSTLHEIVTFIDTNIDSTQMAYDASSGSLVITDPTPFINDTAGLALDDAGDFNDILAFVNAHNAWFPGTLTYDAVADELTAENTDDPNNPISTTLTNVSTADLDDIMVFIANNLSQQVNYDADSETLEIVEYGFESEEITLQGTTVGDFIDWVNAREGDLGATAHISNGELRVTAMGDPIILHSEDMSLFGGNYGLLDGNAEDIEDAGAARFRPILYEVGLTRHPVGGPAQAEDLISSVKLNGIELDAASDKIISFDDGNGITTFAINQNTTIQDLLTFINQTPPAGIDAQADLHNGQLRIRGLGDQLEISSQILSTDAENPVRLWDPSSRVDTNPRRQLTYSDVSGVEHTVNLYQRSGSADGLGFTNLTGIGEPIFGLRNQETSPVSRIADQGAWSLSMRNMSQNHSGLFINDDAAHGLRRHAASIQIGSASGDKTHIEISDMRAGALGQSAFRQQIADGTSENTLLNKGFFSIEDLSLRQALLEGDAQDALAVIDAAIDEVSTMRSRLGSQQASLLEPTVNNLRLGIENLTSSESRIRDIDFAAESASFARHQIMYEAATAMLAQANQVPNSVLQLLGGR